MNSVRNVSDHLVTRSVVEVEPYSKALKARQSRSKADGSPKESAPENWEQIIEGIRYFSSDFCIDWEVVILRKTNTGIFNIEFEKSGLPALDLKISFSLC